MKFLVVLVCGILLCGLASASTKSYFNLIRHREPPPPAPAISSRVVSEKWITQKLDHFNTADSRSFQMRYYANDEFYQPGGPIFIYVGGEWTISSGWVTSGHMVDMAREMNGYVFYTEHRYYGKTKPTSDLSVANLQYLDVDQALEDLAHFIRVQKSIIPGAANSGVILVGGSYSAMMVSWFRQRYPNLVRGAWASSAPIQAKVDFREYKEIVGQSVNLVGGATCYGRIERAFAQIANIVDSGNYARLNNEFKLCTPLSSTQEKDIWSFFDGVSGMLSGVVQSHYIGSTDIQDACTIIMNPAITDDLSAYAAYVASLMGDECFDHIYSNTVDYFSGTTWESDAAQDEWRQWWWQTCNEFGFYQTLSSANQPFGMRAPVELHTQVCVDAYSSFFSAASVEQNVQRTNTYNFGLNPAFTNVFSTQGQLDPWRAMGLQVAPNGASPVTVIPLASHCNDLYSMSDNDTPEMRAAKEQIRQLVIQWLG